MPYLSQSSLPFSEPTTSRDAAIKAAAFAGTQREQVYAFIKARGTATMKEAEIEMPIARSSACARFFELVAEGRIARVAGERRESCGVYEIVK